MQFAGTDGEFWVRGTMTIGGITRVEFGDGSNPKEAIGNFIRRGAMRFGVAIDLWAREELESEPVEPVQQERKSSGVDGMAGTDQGAGYGEGSAPTDTRALSSQVRTLLRIAQDLRWVDSDIAAALHEAFPGVSDLKELTQVQARELIPTWEAAARAFRINDEQVQEIRTLASLADAKIVAERLFGRKVPNIHTLTHPEGVQLIEALREARAMVAT
jgi:hypothetical protein